MKLCSEVDKATDDEPRLLELRALLLPELMLLLRWLLLEPVDPLEPLELLLLLLWNKASIMSSHSDSVTEDSEERLLDSCEPEEELWEEDPECEDPVCEDPDRDDEPVDE